MIWPDVISGLTVFHVTDQLGNKITDEKLIEFLQQVRYRHICQIEESRDYM